jgi:hypothetical protein
VAIFTSSKVGVFPARLITALSLQELAASLLLKRPDQGSLSSGWGGPTGASPTLLGVRNVAPPISDPTLIPADDDHPERLHARYYFFRTTSQLREVYEDGTDQEQHVLDAIDVFISRENDSSASYLMLFSSSNSAIVATGPFASLREQVLAADPSATTSISASDLHLTTPDIFLWLLTRMRQPQLDSLTTLAGIDAVSGQDSSYRVTALTDGVDFDRPAFLVAVAELEHLGPVRVMLKHGATKSRVTFDIWVDGSFRLITSQSHYSMTSAEDMRLRAVADLAYIRIPLMKNLYGEDDAWRETGRDAEILAAARSLIERYRLKYPSLAEQE